MTSGIKDASSSVSTEAAGAHPEFTTEFNIAKDPGMGPWTLGPAVWTPARATL